MAHFCTETGVRIAAPGVSKSVDPENGHDEVREEAPATPAPSDDKASKKAAANSSR